MLASSIGKPRKLRELSETATQNQTASMSECWSTSAPSNGKTCFFTANTSSTAKESEPLSVYHVSNVLNTLCRDSWRWLSPFEHIAVFTLSERMGNKMELSGIVGMSTGTMGVSCSLSALGQVQKLESRLRASGPLPDDQNKVCDKQTSLTGRAHRTGSRGWIAPVSSVRC